MKDKLELCVERLGDRLAGIRENAMKLLKDEISSATSSITSVPKPLKFLNGSYTKLKQQHANCTDPTFKVSPQIASLTKLFVLIETNL